MADIVTQGDKLSITLTMYRADDDSTKTRTFSIDNPVIDETGEQFRQKLQALQNFLLGDGATLIQPTGWRDDDSTEAEYTTTAVAFATSSEVETKWDTKLPRNLTIAPSTISLSSLSDDLAAEAVATISGDNTSGLIIKRLNAQAAYIYETTTSVVNTQNYEVFLAVSSVDSAESAGAQFEFYVPAEGVYQEGSVTLTITR